MTTQAAIGHGTLFQIGDGASPEVFTTVAEVTNVGPPPLKRDILDATHMESPGGWREFIPGLKDGGEAKIDGNFVPGGEGQDQLLAAQIESEPRNYRITFPNAEVWGFSAYCTGYEPQAPVDGKMTFSATFKVTGQPDFIPSDS